MITTLLTKRGNATLLSIKVICLGDQVIVYLNIQIFNETATRK